MDENGNPATSATTDVAVGGVATATVTLARPSAKDAAVDIAAPEAVSAENAAAPASDAAMELDVEAEPQNGARPDGFAGRAALPEIATVKVWLPSEDGSLVFPELDDPDFAVPGLSEKANVAVCISGGGFRATTLALGWLRGLQHLGLLNQIRYLSVISGASWLGAALTFQQQADVTEFLGPYLPPDKCTPEALKEVGRQGTAYARAVADAKPVIHFAPSMGSAAVLQVLKHLKNKLLNFLGVTIEDRKAAARHWTTAMSKAFLEPFGLGDTDKSTVQVPGTKVAETLKDRAVGAGRGSHVYDANVKDLPFLIIGQAVLLPKATSKFYPFEWTPLYGGCPVSYTDVSPKLGAGWIETLGLNAALVGKPSDCGDGAAKSVSATVRPMGPGSLAEATGISSGYISLALADKNLPDVVQKALGFHSAKSFNTQDWETEDLLFTDGGGYDLYGIYPALRRQVPNIMVFNCNGTPLRTLEAFSSDKDLPGLFGCVKDDPEYNRMRQVFKPEDFQGLFEALKKKQDAGLAPVHVGDYEVLENTHLGIKGGWTARVMWVMNERMAEWEKQLPDTTRAKLKPMQRGMLSVFGEAGIGEFPYVDTFFMDYTNDLVSLLSNHAAWMLVSNADLVREMVLGQKAPAAAAAEPAAESAPATEEAAPESAPAEAEAPVTPVP